MAAGCAFAVALAFVASPSACLLTVSLDGLSGGQRPEDAGGGGGGSGGTSGCKTGFADCNTDSVCETNISSDGKNCGTCNHDCQGSTCANGLCDPVVVASGTNPAALALDASYVYWVNQGSGDVKRRRKDASGAVDVLATGQSNPLDIAVDDTNVYWINQSGTVTSSTKVPGGTPKNLATQQTPLAIAIDATSVYWANSGSPGAIMKVSKAGGTAVTVAGNVGGPSDVAVSGSDVFFIAFGELKLKKVGTGGGTQTELATALVNPMSITVDSTYVYLAEEGSDGEGFNDGAISRIPKTGGNREVLAANQGAPHSIAVAPQSDFVYFGLFGNGVMMGLQLPAANQPAPPPVTIATKGPGAKSVAVDDTAVFWIANDANIWKVAR